MQQMKLDTDSWEYADAFRSIRLAQGICWGLILAAVLFQVFAFVAVRFLGVLDSTYQAGPATAGPSPSASAGAQGTREPNRPSAPTTQPSSATRTAPPATRPEAATRPSAPASASAAPRPTTRWAEFLGWTLPGTRFFAMVASLVLILTLLLAVKLSLLDHMGGVAGLTSAMLWSLVLFAMLTPWQQVLQGGVACGALFGLSDLTAWTARVRPSGAAASPASRDVLFYYLRFLVYPIAALATAALVQIKFIQGLRRMVFFSQPRPIEIRAPASPVRPARTPPEPAAEAVPPPTQDPSAPKPVPKPGEGQSAPAPGAIDTPTDDR